MKHRKPNYTISEVKKFIRQHFDKGEGLDCPCCGQFVKKYKYKLFATSARALIDLYKLTEKTKEEYHHIRKFAEARGEMGRASHFAELRFWGMVEPMDSKTAVTNASGMWKITQRGIDFVHNFTKVQKYVFVFNNKHLGFEGEYINIYDALENKFNYTELFNS